MNLWKYKALFTTPLSLVLLFLAMLAPMQSVWAAGQPKQSDVSNPIVITLLVVVIGLLLVIGILANVVLSAAGYYSDKKKAAKGSKLPLVVMGILMTIPAVAGDNLKVGNTSLGLEGVSDFSFYTLVTIIFLELVVIGTLLYNLKLLLRFKEENVVAIEEKSKPAIYWFEKWNRFVARDKEHTIDMGHDYDGIRELDNRLPPWWLYGFYLSIIFSVIYLWHYHVTGAGPSSVEEFQITMAKAKIEQEAYLKKAANRVDETSVEMITDAGQLTAGKGIYMMNCVACHGKEGEGGVGPNLTDAYWLHGGSVKDIFKVVKYGVPEKGMKSWMDDFSPAQIAQVASYIKTLKGTNPSGAKEKQGDLFEE